MVQYKILKNQIDKEKFDDVLENGGHFDIYQYMGNKLYERGGVPLCKCYHIEYAFGADALMTGDEIPLNHSIGTPKNPVSSNPSEVLRTLNKYIGNSIADKSITVVATTYGKIALNGRKVKPAVKKTVRKPNRR